MWTKLTGAPKRNRSGRCSEVWEYQKQNCKGACANFLVSHGGPFGSATKINQKKCSKIFWDKKFVTKSRTPRKQVKLSDRLFFENKTFSKTRFGGDSCAVKWIQLPGGADLGGSLHPQILKLTNLQGLDLGDTNVSGSLEVLANHTKLEWLTLRHTRVGGRLEDLSKAKYLVDLDLTGTEVKGDLAALANPTKLGWIRLSNTAVSGELNSLAKLTELKELDLSNTAVSGELKSLAKLKRLQKLDLANVKVVGDAAVMAEWSKIEHVDISATQVEFVKTDFLQKFEPVTGKHEEKWQCPLPALRFLDVSRTPQFSPAQDLLRPFAGCGKLATLKAAGCGLSGPLWPEILHPFGAYILHNHWWPLSQALSVLDFARNNVTAVAELLRSCRRLVLSGNPHVSFGAGVVEKAIKDIVFIDLRNATFANLSDP